MHAIGIGPHDEVIVPAMTFAATSNAVLYQRGRPVFADIDPGTLLIDVNDVARKITRKTRAIIAVDYAGAVCDYPALRALADQHRLTLVADACHALGASSGGEPVGSLADLTCFSMHPVKPITSGEGGFVTTNNPFYAERMRCFRNHGIDRDFRQRQASGSWKYAMRELGFNYRLSDIHAALALSQLNRLTTWTQRRQHLASLYDAQWSGRPYVRPLLRKSLTEHAFHLYVVRWIKAECGVDRDAAVDWLRQKGINVNVHYLPVYLHPFYQRRLRIPLGTCPVAEQASEEIISLPLFPDMLESDVGRVVEALEDCRRRARIA
jgi:perosamine synthetase